MSRAAWCRICPARNLYIAIGILGATVMPHNLYLHSALVQTRRIGKSEQEKRTACRFNLIDSTIALNGALLVNAAIWFWPRWCSSAGASWSRKSSRPAIF